MGFQDGATVMKITEKNTFFGLIRGFVVHFDTKAELYIHSNDVIVHRVSGGKQLETKRIEDRL